MISWDRYLKKYQDVMIINEDSTIFDLFEEAGIVEGSAEEKEFIKCKIEIIKHNNTVLKKVKKLVQDLKSKVSHLDSKINVEETPKCPDEIIDTILEQDEKNIDVSYYVSLILDAKEDMYDECLPSLHEVDYEYKIASIIVELNKEIKSAIELSYESDAEDKIELNNYIKKIRNILAYISKTNNQNSIVPSNNQEEKPNIIFLTKNKVGDNTAHLVSDLEYYVDSSNWMDYKKLMDDFISGKFLSKIGNTEKNRSFNSNNQKLKGLCEVKNDQARIIYYNLGNNNYILIKAFSKKDDKSALVTMKLLNAMDNFKDQEEEIRENLNNPEFLVEQQSYIEQTKRIFAKRIGG